MPRGTLNCKEHIPNLKERNFINGKKQQVSLCKKCGCLLYREVGKHTNIHGTMWYKPIYKKVKARCKK